MGYSGKNATDTRDNERGYHRFARPQTRQPGNCGIALTLAGPSPGPLSGLAPLGIAPEMRGTSFPIRRCSYGGVEAFAGIYRHLTEEVTMATQRHGQIVETPTEARQGEPGPSVLALLSVSTGLAVLILGIV